MKKAALIHLVCCAGLAAAEPAAPIPAPAPAGVLTLSDALARAESANPTVLTSRESLVQAEESARQQRAGLMPQVTFDSTQRRSRTASVGGVLVRSGINNRFDSVLNGRLDLLNPQRIASYKASALAVNVAELDAEQTRQAMISAVAEAYFTHLRNGSRRQVLDANIAQARTLLELARRQFEAGVATQIDVTRAEAQLAVAEQARLQQDTVVQASEIQLKQLLFLDLASPLQLEELHIRRAEVTETAAGLEQSACERRADLWRAERLLEQSQMEVRAAKSDRLPSLALIGSLGVATGTILDGNDANVWSGSVALSLPVFDGHRLRSAVGLAQSRLRAQEIRVHQLKLQISAEVRLAAQDARSRLAQIAVAEKNQALAEDELRLARLRYEQGVADNREVVDAQNRLAQARDNLVEAVHQYNLSRVELARSRGEARAVLQEKAE